MSRLSARLLKLRIMANRNMHYGSCQLHPEVSARSAAASRRLAALRSSAAALRMLWALALLAARGFDVLGLEPGEARAEVRPAAALRFERVGEVLARILGDIRDSRVDLMRKDTCMASSVRFMGSLLSGYRSVHRETFRVSARVRFAASRLGARTA